MVGVIVSDQTHAQTRGKGVCGIHFHFRWGHTIQRAVIKVAVLVDQLSLRLQTPCAGA